MVRCCGRQQAGKSNCRVSAFAKQIATVVSGYDDVVIDTGAADERDISGQIVAFGGGSVSETSPYTR